MKKGFTLIELLVVVAIIGLLSLIIAAPIKRALGIKPKETEQEYCKHYENSIQSNLPVKCLKYYVK